MSNVVSFPGNKPEESEPQVPLEDWMATIVDRLEGAALDQVIVIALNDAGEQVIYAKNDIRKDQYVGILYIAIQQGLFDGIAP